MRAIGLSDAAIALLRRRLAGEWVAVTEETRPLYEELASAGLMEPLHTFANGPRGHYRLTAAGVSALSTLLPSCGEAPAPRG